MHDQGARGNDFFKCDFCRRSWAEDRPMVEGHQGSLICGPCLTVAYTEVVVNEAAPLERVEQCALCLEERKQPGWRSPAFEEVVICLRCIKQSATVFEKDKDYAWVRPG